MKRFFMLGVLALMCIISACNCSKQEVSTSSGGGGSGGGSTGPIEPVLVWNFEGPPAQSIEMGSTADLFCFSLEAQGADLDVRLPVMGITAIDGGRVITNALTGVVFDFPYVAQDSEILIAPVKVSISDDEMTEGLENFRDSTIHLVDDQILHACVKAGIVSWSATSEDFYGKSYQVVMEDWGPEDVVVSDTQAFVPRERIVAPAMVNGDLLTVVGNPHQERYADTLHVLLDVNTPAGTMVAPGQARVPLLTFDLSADGTGACVRGLDVSRQGSVQDTDTGRLYFHDVDSGKDIYSDEFRNGSGKVTFGWHKDALLFCLEGGEKRRYTVLADIAASAQSGRTLGVGIADPQQDIDRVKGAVQGTPMFSDGFVIGM